MKIDREADRTLQCSVCGGYIPDGLVYCDDHILARYKLDGLKTYDALDHLGITALLKESAVVDVLHELNAELKRYKKVVAALDKQDPEALREKIKWLKQQDGELWAIGELVERALKELEEGAE